MTIAFVTSPLDRAHQLRKDSAALAAFRGNPASKLVKIQGDSVAMRNGDLDVAHQGIPADAVFLGQDLQNQAWFAATVPESASLVSIRALMIESAMPPDTVSILAQARSLAGWHARHGFCANCGSATTALDGGYRRHCANCATDHFPRTDPVVIMAVRHGDNFLLGRQASWPVHMYSSLAGFMEPGETIEQAVRREVFEETAIRVGKVSYVASQPWPYPSSLMIGMIAQADTREITIDPDELEVARWFSGSELQLMLAGKHPDGLWASRPQAIAHLVLSEALRLSLG
jgi:NAD+ diphosphatase